VKKKSTPQSACFNLRVLIGLFVVLADINLALAGFTTSSARRAAPVANTAQAWHKYNAAESIKPLVPPGFDCSKIHELGIDKMENLRAGAIMIFCGQAQGGKPSPSKALSQLVQKLLPQPLAYGGADVDLVTGAETSAHMTQSETFTTANPD